MYNQFEQFAKYLEEAYDCAIIYDKETGLIESVICPDCCEPILFEDWSDIDTENWTMCPICGCRE